MSELRAVQIDATGAAMLATGAAVVVQSAAIFRIEGPGAIACMQGIVSNDVQKRGPNRLCYGGVLTPKGMIIYDGWFLRDGDAIVVVTDPAAHEAALASFKRQLPPRLAKVTDLSSSHRWMTIVGAKGRELAIAAGYPSHAGELRRDDATQTLMGLAPTAAPFSACAVMPLEAQDTAVGALTAAGATLGTAELADAARILAGFPALGAEIDDKTLPQEVRFDENAGVSYDKGCYTGQETVARIHFRGHPNRELRLLQLAAGDGWDRADLEIRSGEKVVGTVRSLLELPDRWVGLAPIRREVAVGAEVQVLSGTATVGVPEPSGA